MNQQKFETLKRQVKEIEVGYQSSEEWRMFETLFEWIKYLKDENEVLTINNKDYVCEIEGLYSEIDEYKKIDLTSAEDKLKWDKMIEIYPKLSWADLTTLELKYFGL